jgi:acyl-CoA thioester hydrolase
LLNKKNKIIKMLRKFEGAHFVRVRYSETDKMGFCYYGNYATFLELGRVELLRENKIVYKELEDLGILLPVSELSIKYLHPAKYDDLLKIKTTISDLKGARIYFNYEIFNEKEILLLSATTTLVFVDAKTMRPIAAPDFILDILN